MTTEDRKANLQKLVESGALTPEEFETLTGEPYASASYQIGSVGSNTIIAQGDNITILKIIQQAKKEKDYYSLYCAKLYTWCNALPLAAIGSTGAAGLDVRLADVYIDLDTDVTETKLPDGMNSLEDVIRHGKTSTKKIQFEKVGPVTALRVATEERKLVLLGAPGSGKSSFVKQLAAWPAAVHLGIKEKLPEGWQMVFPIMLTLRDLAVALKDLTISHPPSQKQKTALMQAVWQEWRSELARHGAAECADQLEDHLISGKVLLIFDGLDEVPEAIRPTIRAALAEVQQCYPDVQHTIVTCRNRSYTGAARLPDFEDCTLAPFSDDKIKDFVERWYSALLAQGQLHSQAAASEKTADLQQAALNLKGSDEQETLASNPMLLTTMAIVHQSESKLPDERVKLYKLAVDVLLQRWQKDKGTETLPPAMAELLKDDGRRLLKMMERLAYESHKAQAADKSAQLTRASILTTLDADQYLGDPGLVQTFLDYVDRRAGILIGEGGTEEGGKPATYAFPHRTFQEYLAGCYMVRNRPERLFADLVKQGDYWALPAQLGAEELYYNNENEIGLLDLAYFLAPHLDEVELTAANYRAAVWSGHMACLLGEARILQDDEQIGTAYLKRLKNRLLQAIRHPHTPLTLTERRDAGRHLGALGDPRESLLDIDKIELCPVPAGPFWMGCNGDEREDGSKSQARLETFLDYDYWIGRYPVTNAQYKPFVDDNGYKNPDFWTEAIAAEQWAGGQIKRFTGEFADTPYDYGDAFDGPNQPVVGINWYEMLAYTRWLTQRWRRSGLISQEMGVILPSEAEWEKAARGGIEILDDEKKRVQRVDQLNKKLRVTGRFNLIDHPMPKQPYPWGEAEPTEALTYNNWIGSTVSAGLFLAGKSPSGAEDMSGFIYEWTRSLYKNLPYIPVDGREVLQRKRRDRTTLKGLDGRDRRVCARYFSGPYGRVNDFGFRVLVVALSSLPLDSAPTSLGLDQSSIGR